MLLVVAPLVLPHVVLLHVDSLVVVVLVLGVVQHLLLGRWMVLREGWYPVGRVPAVVLRRGTDAVRAVVVGKLRRELVYCRYSGRKVVAKRREVHCRVGNLKSDR